MRILLLDNYDSFTFNLYQAAAQLNGGRAPHVARNDEITLDEIRDLEPERILLSPGPGHPGNPAYFGICQEVLREMGPTVPILGVCLGHLGLAAAFGARIVRSEPCHGRAVAIRHDGRSIFHGLPDPLDGMRYHSLSVARAGLPGCLEEIAWTDPGPDGEGLIMALRHRDFPLVGVQFHPESIGTPQGGDLLKAFLNG